MRHWLGVAFIKIGFALVGKDTRRMFRNIVMYHVPGALTEDEKAEVRAAKGDWIRSGRMQRS